MDMAVRNVILRVMSMPTNRPGCGATATVTLLPQPTEALNLYDITTREKRRLAMRDPDAHPITLLGGAHEFPQLALRHPSMAMLSLGDPSMWQRIVEAARSTMAWRAYRKYVLSLPLPKLKRLFVDLMFHNATALDECIGAEGTTERQAHLMAAVLDGDLEPSQIWSLVIAANFAPRGDAPVTLIDERSRQREAVKAEIGVGMIVILGLPPPDLLILLPGRVPEALVRRSEHRRLVMCGINGAMISPMGSVVATVEQQSWAARRARQIRRCKTRSVVASAAWPRERRKTASGS